MPDIDYEQNTNRKRRLIIIASAMIALVFLASIAGSCANRQPEITAQDITININGEACESLEVYAGGETVALTVKLKDKTYGFELKWIISGGGLGSTVSESGVFAPGNTAGNVTLKVEVTQGKTVVTKTLTVTVKQRELLSIAVTFMPKTSYIEGQTFVTDGLVITDTFEAGISELSGYMVSKTTVLVPSDANIEITYTENGSTAKTNIAIALAPKTLQRIRIDTQPAQTANIAIVVSPRTLIGIAATNPAIKLTYTEGKYFDILGLFITALYSDAPIADVVSWTHDKPNALTVSDSMVAVTYTESGITEYKPVTDIYVYHDITKLTRVQS
jgi:PKD repeat protein